MTVHFTALPTEAVQDIRQTRKDAYGNPVEVHTSDGDAWPCRHCLGETPEGKEYLILAHRPFRSDNPYAETGPIFLCADECSRAKDSTGVPPILRHSAYLVRGYDTEERIVYGSGKVTPTRDIPAYAAKLLQDKRIAFVDVRSASNNCFQCRVMPCQPA